MSELFDAQMVEGKSPRLRWMEKHNLVTHDFGEGGESPETGMEYKRWVCRQVVTGGESDCGAQGDTEADAVADWAKRKHVRRWNEETLP